MNSAFSKQWQDYKLDAENALTAHLPSTNLQPVTLHEAMHYACTQGGKRFRACLVYATGSVFGADKADLNKAAAAIEMMHAYSLVHDDLPAMDDDDTRRGKASCHIAFDEAQAILAGDALQSEAYVCLAGINSSSVQAMVKLLALSSGAAGMAGGQSLDIQATGQSTLLAELKHIHNLKTGALIQASVLLGAYCSPRFTEHKEYNVYKNALIAYSKNLGLAFQVVDDVLDCSQTSEQLGKPSGADLALNKSTYPSLLGVKAAKAYAQELKQNAIQQLASLPGDTTFLSQLAEFAISRDY